MAKHDEETPLMRQYQSFKQKYPDAILLFRVGDFYEMFGEDAIKASKILNIQLTKRNNGKASEIELAGFPHHSIDVHLPKLVKAGQRVAVCDQLEDPKLAKGIVKRGVTEVLSPGILTNEKVLEHSKNNYICSLFFYQNQNIGIAFCDISTGDFFCFSIPLSKLEKILFTFEPSEVILPRKDLKNFKDLFHEDFYTYRLEDWIYEKDFAIQQLLDHFQVQSLKGFGLEEEIYGSIAAGAILHYLKYNEQHQLNHLKQIHYFADEEFLYLDKFTIRNLELIHSQYNEGKSLSEILDETQTAMGARLLRKWILMPLRNIILIENRLNKIQELIQFQKILSEIREKLSYISDIERLAAKLSMLKLNPREAIILKQSLTIVPEIKNCIQHLEMFQDFIHLLPDCSNEVELLKNTLIENPALSSANGFIIQEGISQELEELRNIQEHAQKVLLQIQQTEALNTGIANLKVDFNKVHGYYIEISKAHKNKVPDYFERRQTLTNAERYITPELKELEVKVLTAEEKRVVLEQKLYVELLQKLQLSLNKFQETAKIIAQIDVLSNIAQIAIQRNYCKPEVYDNDVIEIIAGRHPVIEKMLPIDKTYIPNDVYLDNSSQQIIILTGPNMAGKSAFLRQVGLITLMAQAGFYVPAQQAKIGLVDKIFTRVGASDNLAAGESTFMVEMNETARIINNASPKSLILLDEIGRGTSTFDGISIAWSLVEFLHNEKNYQSKTIFATHYHELTELANSLQRVKNFNVKVKEMDGKILFLRKLEAGSSEHSFGIQVAAMAGLPKSIIDRANEVLQQFENQRIQQKNTASQIPVKTQPIQMKLFELMDEDTLKLRKLLSHIDIDRMTPVEALLKLQEIKREILDKH